MFCSKWNLFCSFSRLTFKKFFFLQIWINKGQDYTIRKNRKKNECRTAIKWLHLKDMTSLEIHKDKSIENFSRQWFSICNCQTLGWWQGVCGRWSQTRKTFKRNYQRQPWPSSWGDNKRSPIIILNSREIGHLIWKSRHHSDNRTRVLQGFFQGRSLIFWLLNSNVPGALCPGAMWNCCESD